MEGEGIAMPSLSRSCKGKFGRCDAIVSGSERYCPECKPDAVKRQPTRPEKVARDAVYRTTRWRNLRAFYLRRHPLCVECERNGRITPSVAVDHIVPHRGDMALFYAGDNLQALCASCHNSKSAGGE
jgi:5-methylcytosine-specific restriction protein A